MATIMSKDTLILVDDEEFEKLCQYKWRISLAGQLKYACARINKETVYMHRLIMNAPKGLCVDHINGDTLDNQKNNLRICTHAQNLQNCRSRTIKKTSKYRGVYRGSNNKWIAQINIRWNGTTKTKALGSFESEYDAACARDIAAIKEYGPFARLNTNASEEP